MVIRNILLVICLFSLFLPVYAKDTGSKLYLTVSYKGSDTSFEKIVPDLLKEKFIEQSMFEITDDKNGAAYVLSCVIEDDNEDLILSIEITGSTGYSEVIVKREKKGNGIDVILQEVIEYINRKVFPYEIFQADNELFFTTKTMKDYYGSDVINRSKTKKQPLELFDPLVQKIFVKNRFQIFPSLEVSFPLNLMDRDIHQSLYIHIPFYFYLYTTELFMVYLLAEVQYVNFTKEFLIGDPNELHLITLGGGAGICYPLPFYKQMALHFNVSGGSAISIVKDLILSKIHDSYDPFIHATFNVEHTITRNISLSLKVSYIWVEYHSENEDLHLLQSGVGIGFRF